MCCAAGVALPCGARSDCSPGPPRSWRSFSSRGLSCSRVLRSRCSSRLRACSGCSIFSRRCILAWLFAEAPRSLTVRRAAVAVAVAAAIGRGVFVWGAEHAGSPVARIGFPQDNWTDVMQWISRTPPDTHVLADPGHAWKYGSSVRVTGERDVYLEEVKDLALALYSRDVAVEALRRIADVARFRFVHAGSAACARRALRPRLSRGRTRRRSPGRLSQRTVSRVFASASDCQMTIERPSSIVHRLDSARSPTTTIDDRDSLPSPAGRGATG